MLPTRKISYRFPHKIPLPQLLCKSVSLAHASICYSDIAYRQGISKEGVYSSHKHDQVFMDNT